MSWEFLPHTADIRVRFTAPDLTTLFADATDLVRLLTAGPTAEVVGRETRALRLEAATPGELLRVFLRELLFLFATEQFVPAAIDLRTVGRDVLDATVSGEAFDPDRHELQPEVKGVTRHGLRAERCETGEWEAEVVFDL